MRGEVTAIGGLKEKLLAALRGGIKTVLIPEENVKDLQEIPENVKNGLEIVPVRWIDKVLEIALEKMPTPLPDEVPSGACTSGQDAVAKPSNRSIESLAHTSPRLKSALEYASHAGIAQLVERNLAKVEVASSRSRFPLQIR